MPNAVDYFSLSAIPVRLFRGTTSFDCYATAFVWRRRDKHYLVTSWHVVTGRDAVTGQRLFDHGGEPDRLQALFRPYPNIIDTIPVEIALRGAEDKPLWLFHPVHRRLVDVVAIPIDDRPNGAMLRPVNAREQLTPELSIQVAMDLYVLGYPFGDDPPSLPVWKRASMASEPDLVRLAQLYYLVDTASRPGMSGGPVIRRSYGTHLTTSGPSITTAPATKFLGIYSGRIYTDDQRDLQLARVFPESLLVEIIDANIRDDGRPD